MKIINNDKINDKVSVNMLINKIVFFFFNVFKYVLISKDIWFL